MAAKRTDSDTVKTTAVAVPRGPLADPVVHNVPLDAPLPAVAYEERSIADHELFASFGPPEYLADVIA